MGRLRCTILMGSLVMIVRSSFYSLSFETMIYDFIWVNVCNKVHATGVFLPLFIPGLGHKASDTV